MAFKERNIEPEIVETEKDVLHFDTYEEQTIYVLRYLKKEYGIDFNDPNRKPGMHINTPNNPFYVGNVGEKNLVIQNPTINEKTKESLRNFFKNKKS